MSLEGTQTSLLESKMSYQLSDDDDRDHDHHDDDHHDDEYANHHQHHSPSIISSNKNTNKNNNNNTPSSRATLSQSQLSNTSLGSGQSQIVRAQVHDVSAYQLHDDDQSNTSNPVTTGAQSVFDTLRKRTSMFRANLTKQAWVFILIVTISVLVLWSCSSALLWEAFNRKHRDTTVGDGIGLNLCAFRSFNVYLTNSASYAISDLMLGSFFALWYAFRAVRHEKEGLLVVFALVVIGVVGRAVYFSFVTADYWVTGLSLEAIQAFLCLGSIGLLIAVGLTWRVGRSFGWRMYQKGVASADDVKRMGRLKTLDAAAKLDLFLTVNAFNTFFFFAPDRTIRYVGFGCTAVTALFLLAIPVMIKKRMFFVSYIFVIVGLVLPALYTYLLVNVLGPEEGHCRYEHITRCSQIHNVTRITTATFDNFTQFPSFNSTSCVDCFNGTSYRRFSPDMLCWKRTRTLLANGSLAPFEMNETQSSCLSRAQSAIQECCGEFGECELREKLVESNRPMAVFVVVCAIITRIATLVFGVQQARNMDIPSVEEMFRRAERNISAFATNTLKNNSNSGGDGSGTGTSQADLMTERDHLAAGMDSTTPSCLGSPRGEEMHSARREGFINLNSNLNEALGASSNSPSPHINTDQQHQHHEHEDHESRAVDFAM